MFLNTAIVPRLKSEGTVFDAKNSEPFYHPSKWQLKKKVSFVFCCNVSKTAVMWWIKPILNYLIL